MTIFEAIILGIIQGLTEFLPVSSSGHLEIGSYLLDTETSDNLLFTIVVHAATALSTIIVFRKDILTLIRELFKFQRNESTDYVFKLVISMIPIGIVGVFFEEQIEGFFGGNILFVGSMLLITSTLLAFTYFKKNTTGSVTFGKSILIGLAQAVAILPGISRSGSTIATALLLGVDKEKAARFSFLMVLAPILGATLLKVKDYVENPALAEGVDSLTLMAGFLAAFISGLIACIWMINIVKRGKLIYFAIYCFIIGSIAILASI